MLVASMLVGSGVLASKLKDVGMHTDLQEILPSTKDAEYVTTPSCTQVKRKCILVKERNFDKRVCII